MAGAGRERLPGFAGDVVSLQPLVGADIQLPAVGRQAAPGQNPAFDVGAVVADDAVDFWSADIADLDVAVGALWKAPHSVDPKIEIPIRRVIDRARIFFRRLQVSRAGIVAAIECLVASTDLAQPRSRQIGQALRQATRPRRSHRERKQQLERLFGLVRQAVIPAGLDQKIVPPVAPHLQLQVDDVAGRLFRDLGGGKMVLLECQHFHQVKVGGIGQLGVVRRSPRMQQIKRLLHQLGPLLGHHRQAAGQLGNAVCQQTAGRPVALTDERRGLDQQLAHRLEIVLTQQQIARQPRILRPAGITRIGRHVLEGKPRSAPTPLLRPPRRARRYDRRS